VLTLWVAVVAERLGFDCATALTLGQAVAGLSAYAKGVSLGTLEPRPKLVREQSERLAEGEQLRVDLLGRAVQVVRTPDGLRAMNKGKPGSPAQIERYLASKFKDRLDNARTAMAELAAACEPVDLVTEPGPLTRERAGHASHVLPEPAGAQRWSRKAALACI
jgi:hypothetical protein